MYTTPVMLLSNYTQLYPASVYMSLMWHGPHDPGQVLSSDIVTISYIRGAVPEVTLQACYY